MAGLPPNVVQAVSFVNGTVVGNDAPMDQAEGAAYQLVAQASAAVVADAAEMLRSMNMVNLAAISTMTARMVEGGDAAQWAPAILAAQQAALQSSEIFKNAGASAAEVLRAFRGV